MSTELWSEYLKRITRCRWEKNINTNLKMYLDKNRWETTAQGRDQRHTVRSCEYGNEPPCAI